MPKKIDPKVEERCVRLVLDHVREYRPSMSVESAPLCRPPVPGCAPQRWTAEWCWTRSRVLAPQIAHASRGARASHPLNCGFGHSLRDPLCTGPGKNPDAAHLQTSEVDTPKRSATSVSVRKPST